MRWWWLGLVVLGCRKTPTVQVPSEADTDADSDTDTDTDTDTDSDTDVDTGPEDADGDGFSADVDCDDSRDDVYPGAPELCNGRDDACDGVDPGDEDADNDGVPDCQLCDDKGWWAPTVGLSGEPLAQTIGTRLGPITCTYDNAREFMFETLDVNGNGQLECVYTATTATPDGTNFPGDLINTEHTWPQSLGASFEPPKCDLHHLFPTDAVANSRRGNHPYGLVTSASWTEGTAAFGDDANGDRVFQPPESHRGNAARALLYFALQYDHTLEPDYKALLLQWDDDDPVTPEDIERTNAIETEQGETNPLVICPFVVERL